ncbi:MAG TPA: FtsX-like permease family protein, partial [Gemmataceae bacterium]|nr:FtsX-like permease family protein [Gemmataceae bacterium]
GNLAVLLGVVVGAAALTGALLVGDSLRGSLRGRAERQLGGVESAALLVRPVRTELADAMPDTAPVLLLQGSIRASTDPDAKSIGRVTVLGVDDRFQPKGVEGACDWNGDEAKVVLGNRVAERLGVKVGDAVHLGVGRISNIPRSSLLARRNTDDVTASVRLTVAAVLPADSASNDFNLVPGPAAPINVFVPLKQLQARVEQKGRVTALLSTQPADALNAKLRDALKPDDWGITLRVAPRHKRYVSVESRLLAFDSASVDAVQKASAELGLKSSPTSVYLANWIARGDDKIPYSVVAAVDPFAPEPLGPFLPEGAAPLRDDEILLADWKQSPIKQPKAGDAITITFFKPELEGGAEETTATFKFRGLVPLEGVADDPDLTPPFPGITDKLTIGQWNPPFPYDAKRIKSNDENEKYWQRYKTTPKAYITLAAGEKLFGSRYGWVTSVRVAPGDKETPADTLKRLEPAVRKHLDPASAGLVFDPIRTRMMTASRGGTDFGGLFLGFSFFLIGAALMLVGLLFRLSLDRRAKEVGLLLAAGYAVKTVRRLILAEGLLIAVVGTLIGLALAVAYNRALLAVLLGLWPDGEIGAFLKPHATPLSFGIGFALTVVMALGALWLSVRGLVKVPPPALLRGETAVAPSLVKPTTNRARNAVVGLLTAGVGALVVGPRLPNPDFRAMAFFAGGAYILAAGLVAFRIWMRRERHREINDRGGMALLRVGARNAARNPTRSLLTAGLLASAAFLLVSVESFRRQPDRDFLDEKGGSGGFNLMAEADVPLFRPFDTGEGKADLEDALQAAYGGAATDPRFRAAKAELAGVSSFALRLRGGDDASCLNLYQAARPRLLGVPDALIDRGGFKIYDTLKTTAGENANPLVLLRRTFPDGAIPVLLENNSAQWMLKVAVGDDIKVPGDDGKDVTFRVAGTLVDSPFQSELLLSEENFKRAFPKQEGFGAFLIRTPPGKETDIGRVLETGLRANGFVATPTRDRVAAYQAVIGAYLSTFQLLGGFGLLLGLLGLAVVVLRGVWERLGELALLRAVGYPTSAVKFLVAAEIAVLLSVGLGLGVVAALASVAPHAASGAAVPWAKLLGMLALVYIVGLVVALRATNGILRVPLIPALRRE